MSHNRYRIPSRLRHGIQKALISKEATQKRARCRKGLRRSKQLAIEYMRRHGKVRWLPTHIWMTKRMVMQEYYGYKIAKTPHNKG